MTSVDRGVLFGKTYPFKKSGIKEGRSLLRTYSIIRFNGALYPHVNSDCNYLPSRVIFIISKISKSYNHTNN